ncbi:MAG TPA: hypothetical protein EYH54_05500, partial [Nautiliaceae bacterium]|nr:hypothetical protein [Nautiliaceae bacterium]
MTGQGLIKLSEKEWKDFEIYLDKIKDFRVIVDEIFKTVSSNGSNNSVDICASIPKKLDELKEVISAFERIIRSEKGKILEKVIKRVEVLKSHIGEYFGIVGKSIGLCGDIKKEIKKCKSNTNDPTCKKIEELLENLRIINDFLKDIKFINKILLKNLDLLNSSEGQGNNFGPYVEVVEVLKVLKALEEGLSGISFDNYIASIEYLKSGLANLDEDKKKKITAILENIEGKLGKLNEAEGNIIIAILTFEKIFKVLLDFTSYLGRELFGNKFVLKVYPKNRLNDYLVKLKNFFKNEKYEIREKLKIEEKKFGIKEAIDVLKKQFEDMEDIIKYINKLRSNLDNKKKAFYNKIGEMLSEIQSENNVNYEVLENFKHKIKELEFLLIDIEKDLDTVSSLLKENLFEKSESLLNYLRKLEKETTLSKEYIRKTMTEVSNILGLHAQKNNAGTNI